MSITLFVGPLIDPEEENEEEIARLQAILDDLNAQLAAQELPSYREADPLPDGYEFWNVMFANEWMANLQAVLDTLRQDENAPVKLRHFVDPAEFSAHYFPVDFPEPLPSQIHEDMVYGSCQGLLREIEQLGEWLGIPLERFPMDFSGQGEEKGAEWTALYDELESQGAPFTALRWEGTDLETVMAQIHEFCEANGTDEDEFIKTLIEEHGSLEEYVESVRAEEPSDSENTMGVVFALVHYYHGLRYAIEHGMTFGGA